jgi:PAS domain S-box-containing protein
MPDYKVEFRQRMQDGTYKWILSVGKIVSRDEDGTPLRLIGTHTDIHERKQAEEELQLLASVVENSSDFVGVATIDGNAKYVNPAGQQLVGLANLAAVLETTMFDYFPPTDHDLFCQQVIPTIDAQGTWKGELNFQHFQTGQTIQTEFNGFLVRHPETQAPLYYAGIARDITDRKQAEAALRESEERFRQIANNISEVFWLATPDHEILYASPAYEQVWGHPATPLNAETWLETVYPADRERLLTQVDETLPQYPAGLLHANSELEYRIVRPDGEIRWIRDRAFPVYDDQGNLYRIAGVAEDITDRKHLQQEQQRLLSLLEASPDHIGVAYPDGTLIWTNQQAKYLRGLPPDTDVTQLSLDIFHPHWAQVVIQQEAIPKALAGEIWMGETALLTADGREIPVSQLVWANRSETGEVEHLSTIMRDISDLKRAEQALREANTDLETRVAERTAELVEACDAAETANQAKSIFLANMSHELRTPLNAILGFSQLMGRDQALSTQHLEELKIINRSGEHLLTLINDILEMSKIEAGQATLNPAQFDLAQLLNSLVDMLRLKAESKGLSLSLAIAPDLPQYICTDGHKLRQVLLNLLSNALKFTQAGYVTLRVVPADLADLPPTSRQSQNLTTDASTLVALRFEIEDSGAGIAAEELDLLFEPFAQTASGRLSQEGTGLGLPISYQFVQLMGGDLTVSSQPDVGSTFAFTIPVQVVDATAIEALASQRRVIGLAPDQPDYRILIVEDNWANRVLLQNLLTGLGFTVKTAVHGQAAIYCWQSWQPHLIFMDIRMPVMNGCEATQEIRHQEQWLQEQGMITTTKIISLTAGVFADTQGDFAEIGFDGFIRKPIKEQDITDTIAQQLAVEYLYEAETVASLEFEPAAIVHLTAEGLQDLPADWLAQFHDALLQLNQTEMLTLINHLPPEQAAVAGALHRKVQDFDFEVLLDLLQSR